MNKFDENDILKDLSFSKDEDGFDIISVSNEDVKYY